MKKGSFLIVLFLTVPRFASSQDTIKPVTSTQVIQGDTVAAIDVKPVVIFPPIKHETKRDAIRYDRLVYNVKKVYPYAKLARQKLTEFTKILDTIHLEPERKKFMKVAEKQLEDQFGDQIRDLTYSQGKILIKLIYRETGNSSYDIVRELRGKFRAFIWQALAVIFGYNLKTTYDPAGEDQLIERIVLMIEAGAI